MNPGELSERVTLLKITSVDDAGGGADPNEASVGTFYAKVAHNSSDPAVLADMDADRCNFWLTMRDQQDDSKTPHRGDVFVWKGRRLQVDTAPPAADGYIRCLCFEVF